MWNLDYMKGVLGTCFPLGVIERGRIFFPCHTFYYQQLTKNERTCDQVRAAWILLAIGLLTS